jgi:lon-related putative ATP-dependent protease
MDADRVLAEPYAWNALKRTLFAKEIRIESLGQMLSMVSTVSVEPEPIPLDAKIILIGERLIYYLLCELDSDFADLFKVPADFEDRISRTAENTTLYSQLLATLSRRESLRPLSRNGVARVIEESARFVGDNEKLSTSLRNIVDLLKEADYWAREDGSDVIASEQVQKAVDAQIRRVDRIRAHLQEEIQRNSILIDTEGRRVGQVNGLSALKIGNFTFGRPSRITATVRIGEGKILDIERETELGGAIHSKGVLILSSYLSSRYAASAPLSLNASLVFEQSYGGVEGDSASVAETCALLSALTEVPIDQSLAVTGSINQHGEVQAIGGVNEKIEGFYDVCKARGLNGQHGVLIPKDNVKHLMLRADVVASVAAGEFAVYAIAHIDDAVSVLTGRAAGQRDDEGHFPADSVNERAEVRQSYRQPVGDGTPSKDIFDEASEGKTS